MSSVGVSSRLILDLGLKDVHTYQVVVISQIWILKTCDMVEVMYWGRISGWRINVAIEVDSNSKSNMTEHFES